MNELTIDGKLYVSSKKASELTGYAKDYVGQLCREGHVEARMVGRSWYVLETSILAHRFGGDPHAESLNTTDSVEAEKEPVSAPNAWGQATYVPDMAPTMPIPTFVQNAQPNRTADTAAPTAETLTDMQAAWKEWFAQKQDTLIETPEIIDEREEEAEREAQVEEDMAESVIESAEPVSIQPIYQPEQEAEQPHHDEIEEESEPVPIHHTSETPRYSAAVPEERNYPTVEREMVRQEEEEVVLTKKERRYAMVQARKARKARRSKVGTGSVILRAMLLATIVLTVAITAIGTGFAERYIHEDKALLPVFNYLGGTSTYSK